MTTFLDVMSFDYAVRGPTGVPPKMMEFPVAPEGAPYLVSSTRSVIWSPKASMQRTVRAAVRDAVGFYEEVFAALAKQGSELKWGNVHPVTQDGFDKCVEHLAYYGFAEIEVLVNPESTMDALDINVVETLKIGDVEIKVSVCECGEVPKGWIVCVPVDRAYVGFVGSVGPGRIVSVVHNPTRGVAIARPEDPNGTSV